MLELCILFLRRLINVLRPGSVRKISSSTQNWHQVRHHLFARKASSYAKLTVIYHTDIIGLLCVTLCKKAQSLKWETQGLMPLFLLQPPYGYLSVLI